MSRKTKRRLALGMIACVGGASLAGSASGDPPSETHTTGDSARFSCTTVQRPTHFHTGLLQPQYALFDRDQANLVDRYGRRFPHSYGGIYIHRRRADDPNPVVLRLLFTAKLSRRARDLAELVPPKSNLELFKARRSKGALHTFQNRLQIGNPNTLVARLGVNETGLDVERNVIELWLRHYRIWKARKLHERYGSKVSVHQHGSGRIVPF